MLTAGDADVRIRPVGPDDVDLYLALRGDAGTVRDLGGPPTAEAGWPVLPGHRGRGVARTAVRLLLGLPEVAARWRRGEVATRRGGAGGGSWTCRLRSRSR